jgi:hypothetical protein
VEIGKGETMSNDNKEHDDLYDQWPASLDDVGINLTVEQAQAIGWHLARSGMVIPTSLACNACKALARAMSSKGQSQNNPEY